MSVSCPDRGPRTYDSAETFVAEELSPDTNGQSFFGHYGGKFDIQFLLPTLARLTRFQVEVAFSGSSAVLVKVKQEVGTETLSWTFCDSGFLLKGSLEKVGEALGFPKTKVSCLHAPLDELIPYNVRDCDVLRKGVESFQDELLELGGELRPTLASCAMRLWRGVYLKHKIPTSEKLNALLRNAYCASRVEVHAEKAARAEYYDINSSFPYSMTFPLPGKFLGTRRRIPAPGEHESFLYFAEATIYVPDSEALPPLPFKHGTRIFFPTGSWRGWFSRPDLELLLETGGRIDRVHRAYVFGSFTDLADYVKDLYERKKGATAQKLENRNARLGGRPESFPGAEIRELAYKYLLNALYGKFGERVEKDVLVFHPIKTDAPGMQLVAPGVYKQTVVKHVPHAHVPVAAYVTALSRALLYRYMKKAKELYYCDTDSVVCGAGEVLPASSELGALKHEGTIRDCEFLAPKIYTFTEDDTDHRVLKAKGFSTKDPSTYERMKLFLPVAVNRMAGVREASRVLNGGFGAVWSPITEKRVKSDTMPKRAKDGNGTRPWSVKEIIES